MTPLKRRHLAWALLVSLLLHLSLLGAPGWRLSILDDTLPPEPAPLDAHLLAPPVRQAVAPPVQRVRRAAPQRRDSAPAPQVVAPVSATPASVAAAPLPQFGMPPAPASMLEAPPAGPPATAAAAPATPSPEFALPRQGRIRFAVSRGDQGFVVGQSVHRWRHDGKFYTLSSVTETTGIAALFRPVQVKQTSEGEIAAEGLRPRAFGTEKNGIAGDAAAFDWAGMKLTLAPGGGSSRAVPLVSGAQDMLSMFYQFSAAFSGVPRELNEIMVATGRKFERYTFAVLREESLATKQGNMRMLHLRTAAGVEAIDIWLGLDLHGLPLKIRYTDREGEIFDQVAEDIEFEGMPGTAGSQ